VHKYHHDLLSERTAPSIVRDCPLVNLWPFVGFLAFGLNILLYWYQMK